MSRLLRLVLAKLALVLTGCAFGLASVPGGRREWRQTSGRRWPSTLITSAPRSASIVVANGPIQAWVKSTTLTPSRGRRAFGWCDATNPGVRHRAGVLLIGVSGAGAIRPRVAGIPGYAVGPCAGSSSVRKYSRARMCSLPRSAVGFWNSPIRGAPTAIIALKNASALCPSPCARRNSPKAAGSALRSRGESRCCGTASRSTPRTANAIVNDASSARFNDTWPSPTGNSRTPVAGPPWRRSARPATWLRRNGVIDASTSSPLVTTRSTSPVTSRLCTAANVAPNALAPTM